MQTHIEKYFEEVVTLFMVIIVLVPSDRKKTS